LTPGVTNIFRGGFYTDVNANFDSSITGAAYVVHGAGTLAFVRTVDETGTQFGGVNGYVMEFGILGVESLMVIPEPSVLVMWLAGLATFYGARRRRRKA
jgi:hypothetical protein